MALLIGDVHGKYDRYKAIIKEHPNSVQVGDMGVGFRKYECGCEDDPYYANPPYDLMVKQNARFIRGNHDNPAVCQRHSQWIADGTIEGNTMFVGGGVSIDWSRRVPGYSWWEDEELKGKELQKVVDLYLKEKPEAMVTHEAPGWVAQRMGYRLFKLDVHSETRDAFSFMADEHKPKVWVFGHWHTSFDQVIEGTRFVCLNELETKEIEGIELG